MTNAEARVILKNDADFIYGAGNDSYDRQAYVIADKALENMDRPKGEWIEVVTGRFPNGEKRTWHYECSACGMGEPPHPIDKDYWDFCPNCGADMRGE